MMNTTTKREYVIEHRKIVGGVKELPLLQVLGTIVAESARDAMREALEQFFLTTDEEILTARPVPPQARN